MELCQGNNHLFYHELFANNMYLHKGGTKHTTIKFNEEKFKFYVFNEENSVMYNLYKK